MANPTVMTLFALLVVAVALVSTITRLCNNFILKVMQSNDTF